MSEQAGPRTLPKVAVLVAFVAALLVYAGAIAGAFLPADDGLALEHPLLARTRVLPPGRWTARCARSRSRSTVRCGSATPLATTSPTCSCTARSRCSRCSRRSRSGCRAARRWPAWRCSPCTPSPPRRWRWSRAGSSRRSREVGQDVSRLTEDEKLGFSSAPWQHPYRQLRWRFYVFWDRDELVALWMRRAHVNLGVSLLACGFVLLGVIHKITGRASAKYEQLIREVETLEEARLKAQKHEALSKMAAGVAHEIRNPLNSIGIGE